MKRALVVFALLMFPLYWIVVTSLKKEIEIFQIPPTLLPRVLNTSSYFAQLQQGDFNMFRSFKNSFVISSCAMLISLSFQSTVCSSPSSKKLSSRSITVPSMSKQNEQASAAATHTLLLTTPVLFHAAMCPAV